MSGAAQLIVLDGANVAANGETVSLTDLWKMSGSDKSQRPVVWLKSDQANRFIGFLGEDLCMGEVKKSHFGLVRTTKGGVGGGVTWAHWQIALAYAKYLSPELHVKCNAVFRAHVEGRIVPTSDFPTELVELIRRTDGICRMLANKVTKIEQAVLAGGHTPQGGFTISIEPKRPS